MSAHQLDILRAWARSHAGGELYQRLARDVQDLQSVEQLTLNMAALMNYRRLHPDVSDYAETPIKGSYLADFDALFHSHAAGNSGRAAEQMIFALIRVLHSFGDRFKDLITFLDTTLDREYHSLHLLDGFSDQYLHRRLQGQPHETAIADFLLGMTAEYVFALLHPPICLD